MIVRMIMFYGYVCAPTALLISLRITGAITLYTWSASSLVNSSVSGRAHGVWEMLFFSFSISLSGIMAAGYASALYLHVHCQSPWRVVNNWEKKPLIWAIPSCSLILKTTGTFAVLQDHIIVKQQHLQPVIAEGLRHRTADRHLQKYSVNYENGP